MKKFNIFEHSQYPRQVVKHGFSWPAFFFGLFWMLAKGLWKFAGMWFAILVLMIFVENAVKSMEFHAWLKTFADFGIICVYVTIMLIPALKGNEWRARKLVDKGYVWKGTVEASTPTQAMKMQQDS